MEFKIAGKIHFPISEKKNDNDDEISGSPLYCWWSIYLVQLNTAIDEVLPLFKKQKFCIMDNLDNRAEWFIIKDTTNLPINDFIPSQCTPINAGLLNDHDNNDYVHIKLESKRKYIVQRINKLQKLCKSVYVLASVYPKFLIYEIDIETKKRKK